MNIVGHRALPSYDGQPVTCYRCGDSGHINQAYPKWRGGGMVTQDYDRVLTSSTTTTCASVTNLGTTLRTGPPEARNNGAEHTPQVSQPQDPQDETGSLTQTDLSAPNEDMTALQIGQDHEMTLLGQENEEVNSQQQDGEQESDDAMEIRETIPENTQVTAEMPLLDQKPHEDVISMKNKIVTRQKASDKEERTMEGTEERPAQVDVRNKAEEKRTSPRRLKRCVSKGPGIRRTNVNVARPEDRFRRRKSHKYKQPGPLSTPQ